MQDEKDINQGIPTLKLDVLTSLNRRLICYFDYEQKQPINKQSFLIQANCKLFRNLISGQTIIHSNSLIKKGILPNQNFQFLVSIYLKQKGNKKYFFLSSPQNWIEDQKKKKEIDTSTYLVINNYNKNNLCKGFPLYVGVIFKLGRVEMKVVQIGNGNQAKRQLEENLSINNIYYLDESITGACKICYASQADSQNFMISPCLCKSVVHFLCLKKWVQLKKVKRSTYHESICYNLTLQCQVCKNPLPKLFSRKKQIFEIISIQRPSKPYLILSIINPMDQDCKEQQCLFVIAPSVHCPLIIGRAEDSGIRLLDQSVSRTHATIRQYNGQFLLDDNRSRYGTLVKFEEDLELDHPIKLQSGVSLYQFSLQ